MIVPLPAPLFKMLHVHEPPQHRLLPNYNVSVSSRRNRNAAHCVALRNLRELGQFFLPVVSSEPPFSFYIVRVIDVLNHDNGDLVRHPTIHVPEDIPRFPVRFSYTIAKPFLDTDRHTLMAPIIQRTWQEPRAARQRSTIPFNDIASLFHERRTVLQQQHVESVDYFFDEDSEASPSAQNPLQMPFPMIPFRRPRCNAVDPECSICLERIAEGEEIPNLVSCTHTFHASCFQKWISREKNTCPNCRRRVSFSFTKELPTGVKI